MTEAKEEKKPEPKKEIRPPMHKEERPRTAPEKKEGNKNWLIIIVVVVALLIMASGMVQLTVLDPNSFNNITININLTQ